MLSGWKFEHLRYKVGEVTKEVKKMFCKICKEFYVDKNSTVAVQGRALGQVDKFIQVRFFSEGQKVGSFLSSHTPCAVIFYQE